MKKIYDLRTPRVKAEAMRLYEDGKGEVTSYEVLCALYFILQEKGESAIFMRNDFWSEPPHINDYGDPRPDEKGVVHDDFVVYDMATMQCAIMMNLGVLLIEQDPVGWPEDLDIDEHINKLREEQK